MENKQQARRPAGITLAPVGSEPSPASKLRTFKPTPPPMKRAGKWRRVGKTKPPTPAADFQI